MQTRERWEFKSDFARKYTAIGRAEGKAEGRAEGKAEGLAEGKAEALLRILERRGVSVSAAQRERVLGCMDVEQLDRWLDRAITAASPEEIFG